MHQAVSRYLHVVVKQQVYQFTGLPFGLANSPQEFTKLLQPVVALLRQQGVKLHVYLDGWLIRADTPEQAKLHAQTTSVCSSFSAGSSTTRNQTSFQVRTFPVHRDAVQHSTIHSGAPTKDVSQGSVRSSALDYRPEHHSQGSAQASRHVGVHGFAGTTEKTLSSPGPVVGRPSMVPEDRELVRLDPSSSVVSVRGGLVGISSSPARSTPRRQGDGSDSLQGCVQFGLGIPARLTLNTGTVVSISTIVAHQRSGDAGRHQRSERLPPTSEVPDDSLIVRQRSDCGLHQERGGHEIAHLMQLTIRLLKWCNRKAITLVPVHLPGVHSIQVDSLSRVRQTLTTEWTMAI